MIVSLQMHLDGRRSATGAVRCSSVKEVCGKKNERRQAALGYVVQTVDTVLFVFLRSCFRCSVIGFSGLSALFDHLQIDSLRALAAAIRFSFERDALTTVKRCKAGAFHG